MRQYGNRRILSFIDPAPVPGRNGRSTGLRPPEPGPPLPIRTVPGPASVLHRHGQLEAELSRIRVSRSFGHAGPDGNRPILEQYGSSAAVTLTLGQPPPGGRQPPEVAMKALVYH